MGCSGSKEVKQEAPLPPSRPVQRKPKTNPPRPPPGYNGPRHLQDTGFVFSSPKAFRNAEKKRSKLESERLTRIEREKRFKKKQRRKVHGPDTFDWSKIQA
jgi:hypothetical protein